MRHLLEVTASGILAAGGRESMTFVII